MNIRVHCQVSNHVLTVPSSLWSASPSGPVCFRTRGVSHPVANLPWTSSQPQTSRAERGVCRARRLGHDRAARGGCVCQSALRGYCMLVQIARPPDFEHGRPVQTGWARMPQDLQRANGNEVNFEFHVTAQRSRGSRACHGIEESGSFCTRLCGLAQPKRPRTRGRVLASFGSLRGRDVLFPGRLDARRNCQSITGVRQAAR